MDIVRRLDMWLDDETNRLLEGLARRLGLNRSGAIRYSVRRAAQQEGIQSDIPLLEGLEAKRGPKPKPRPAEPPQG
jgi:hypothetical protein